MFTGIVERIGSVATIDPRGNAMQLTVEAGDYLNDGKVGESVAVNGVCLTVTALKGGAFTVDVVEETMRRTSLGRLKPGHSVNLERSLRPLDRMGGHFVQGHVDGAATVQEIKAEAESVLVTFSCDVHLTRYLVEKGSVAIEGVSLTLVQVSVGSFQVALIPHTLQVTTLGQLRPGYVVNVEADVLAKYVFKAVVGGPEPV